MRLSNVRSRTDTHCVSPGQPVAPEDDDKYLVNSEILTSNDTLDTYSHSYALITSDQPTNTTSLQSISGLTIVESNSSYLQCFIITPFSPPLDKIYLWIYRPQIVNTSDHKIQLIGRSVQKHFWDNNVEFFSNDDQNFYASSVWGERPFIDPGKMYSRLAGLATSDLILSHVEIEFQAKDWITGQIISIPGFVPPFERPATLPKPIIVGGESGRLERADAAILVGGVNAYNSSLNTNGWAVFRSDGLKLSSTGRKIVDCFLLADAQRDERKNRPFDFAPILPDGFFAILFKADDHFPLIEPLDDNKFDFTEIVLYNCPTLPQTALDKGAAEERLRRAIAEANDDLGHKRVQQIFAASAPPGDSAQVDTGIAARDILEAAGVPPWPTVAPKLWDERKELHASPAVFLYEVYKKWNGIFTLSDIRALDPKLAQRFSDWKNLGKPIPDELSIRSLRDNRPRARARREKALRLG